MIPREGPNVPFDRATIAGIREHATTKRGDAGIYDMCPYKPNWLWYERMLTTLEECQQLRERVKQLEKQINDTANTAV